MLLLAFGHKDWAFLLKSVPRLWVTQLHPLINSLCSVLKLRSPPSSHISSPNLSLRSFLAISRLLIGTVNVGDLDWINLFFTLSIPTRQILEERLILKRRNIAQGRKRRSLRVHKMVIFAKHTSHIVWGCLLRGIKRARLSRGWGRVSWRVTCVPETLMFGFLVKRCRLFKERGAVSLLLHILL